MASSSQSWKATASSLANPIDLERSPSAPSFTDSGYKSGQPSSPSDQLVQNDNDDVHGNDDTISVFSEDTILQDWQDPVWQEMNLVQHQKERSITRWASPEQQMHKEVPNYFMDAFLATTDTEFDIEEFLNFSKLGDDSLTLPEMQAKDYTSISNFGGLSPAPSFNTDINFEEFLNFSKFGDDSLTLPETQAKDCTSMSNFRGFSPAPSFITATNFENLLGKGDNLFFASEPVISASQASLEEFCRDDTNKASAFFAAGGIDFHHRTLPLETICPSTMSKPQFSRFQRAVDRQRSIPKKGLFIDSGETSIIARHYQVLKARLFPMKVKKCRRCKKAKKHPDHMECRKHRQSIMSKKDMLVKVNEHSQKECQICWDEADCPLHFPGGDLDFEKKESIYDVFLLNGKLDGKLKDIGMGKEKMDVTMSGTLMKS